MKNNVIDLDSKLGHQERIESAKWAYTTRRIDRNSALTLTHTDGAPRSGDLVLARVAKIGQHKRVELTNGRKSRLFVGDEIVVTYGNRYAPDQFEAIIPHALAPCHLVAAGGIAALLTFKHGSVKAPTAIEPVGLVTDKNGKVLNLADVALVPADHGRTQPPVIAVVGSSMNAGKTTTAANLVRGLTNAGFSVSAGKVTGTGAGGDIWFMKDAGARRVMDFVDAGHPSTYLISPSAVKQTFLTLLTHLNRTDTDIIVIEIADGLHQTETSALVASDFFANHVDGVLYAAGDALGAIYGVGLLRQWGVRVLAVGGVITRSPLGIREIQDTVDLPVLGSRVLRSTVIEDYVSEWLNQTDAMRLRTGSVS